MKAIELIGVAIILGAMLMMGCTQSQPQMASRHHNCDDVREVCTQNVLHGCDVNRGNCRPDDLELCTSLALLCGER